MFWFTRILVVTTFLLLIAGGLVTSTGSGLAVPDWPLSYGRLMPPMVGGILFEHGHRMIAATIGLLTLVLTLVILGREPRRWVRGLALAAFGAVVLQGILGGLTVLWRLPTSVSVAHACLGQTFFVLVTLLATIYGEQPTPVSVSPEPALRSASPRRVVSQRERSGTGGHGSAEGGERARASSSNFHAGEIEGGRRTVTAKQGLARASLLATIAIYAQLVLGATVRHAGWRSGLIAAHLVGAIVALVAILRTVLLVLSQHAEDRRLTRRAAWLGGLVIVQMGLGLATLVSERAVWIATAHVATGALLLANAAVLTWHAWSGRWAVHVPEGVIHPAAAEAERPWCPSDSEGERGRASNVPKPRWGDVRGAECGHPRRGQVRAYLELTKPRLTLMAVITTFMGFYLGAHGPLPAGRLIATLVGACLIGGGAAALNQYLERDADAQMPRTARRPLPSGRVTPRGALWFGAGLVLLGLATLLLGANRLTALLGASTLASYLWLYTPLKKRTVLCTLVGALPGALPPLMGWAAARGTLEPGAWALFALLFLWQLPHFLALAWLYRDEYARAGFQMLPVLDPTGAAVGRQMALYCLALLPASLIPTVFHVAGGLYFVGAAALSLVFLGIGIHTAVAPTTAAARRLFHASLAYLPGLLALMALDKVSW